MNWPPMDAFVKVYTHTTCKFMFIICIMLAAITQSQIRMNVPLTLMAACAQICTNTVSGSYTRIVAGLHGYRLANNGHSYEGIYTYKGHAYSLYMRLKCQYYYNNELYTLSIQALIRSHTK